MVLVMVVNALGLTQASNVLESLFAYIPNVIGALFVLVIGMFLANFVSGIIRTAAGNASLPRPEMLAVVSRWAIIIFAGTISLRELGIATLLVTTTFNIILGGASILTMVDCKFFHGMAAQGPLSLSHERVTIKKLLKYLSL